MQWQGQGHNRFAGWPSLQRNPSDPGDATDGMIIKRLCIIITNIGILAHYHREANGDVIYFTIAYECVRGPFVYRTRSLGSILSLNIYRRISLAHITCC